ncbi:MAG: hypothetical protein KDA05_08690 [Phycisphaerales bacterium]|nr:hypothetical protein [Phycisphaerales bacterium]
MPARPANPDRPAAGDPAMQGRSTFAKVGVLIAAGGVIACALLAIRQQRLQAFHESAASQLRLRQHEEVVFKLRAEIAERIQPAEVRRMAGQIGPLRTIGSPGGASPTAIAEGARREGE